MEVFRHLCCRANRRGRGGAQALIPHRRNSAAKLQTPKN